MVIIIKPITGGNPFFAFFFIHRYGLVPWKEYPYTGRRGRRCQLDSIEKPIVTVQSWGFLPKNDEDTIQVALRYIGPVSVNINAADPSFLGYGGGIYDNPNCNPKELNHSVLIVGYDQTIVNGKVVRYWIVRNSWGSGWGENGYIRIKRGSGSSSSSTSSSPAGGVCGIARSASIALGGQFRVDRTPLVKDHDDIPPTKKNHQNPYYYHYDEIGPSLNHLSVLRYDGNKEHNQQRYVVVGPVIDEG